MLGGLREQQATVDEAFNLAFYTFKEKNENKSEISDCFFTRIT